METGYSVGRLDFIEASFVPGGRHYALEVFGVFYLYWQAAKG